MQFELSLLSNPIYIDLPAGLIGWLGWFALLGFLVFMVSWGLTRSPLVRTGESWARWAFIFTLLLVLVPLTSFFFAFRLPIGDSLPPPGLPVDPTGPVLVIFICLPFILAAGLLGPFPAFILGLLSGILLAFWDTHNPFTPLEFGLIALFYSALIRQRYSSREFHQLRIPVFASILLSFLYPILFFYSSLFFAGGDLANRLDYTFTHIIWASLAMGVQLIIAGLIGTLVMKLQPLQWGSKEPLHPSPIDRSLPLRLLYNMAPLALILLLTLLVGNWIVAGNAARQMLQNRMADTAELAAEIIPFFLESGHSLLQQLAEDPDWLEGTPEQDMVHLQQARITVPFFSRMILLNAAGEAVAIYPENTPRLSMEERNGVDLALLGVPVQNYPIPPANTGENSYVSFIAAIPEPGTGYIKGVLIGHADITLNPFTRPILSNLKSMDEFNGEGLLLDSENRVMFHTNQLYLGEVYPLPEEMKQSGIQQYDPQMPQFYDDRASDGTRRLVYYQPAVGQPWSVLLTVPAREAQQLALRIASPMLGMILIASIAAAALLILGLRMVTQSLDKLAVEADRIAGGQLNHPLVSTSDDEIGRLSWAFEQMRVSLRTRIDELNLLLNVSQSVASSLELNEAVKPVLDSALTTGAESARIVLTSSALPEIQDSLPFTTRFGAGSGSQAYSVIDEQILALIRQQDRLVLNNLNRVRLIQFPAGSPRPEALLAMALKHENTSYGVLWLAFQQPHAFSEDELRFIATLASQTTLAIANTRSFLNAEIGRQRLASILASTPDPVLVTDHQNRLLLANPAAWQILHLSGEANLGQPIERLIFQPDLVELLKSTSSEKQSAELAFADTRIYLATASPVLAGGRQVGRICVMRDITQFKELDALKSEFVATVSHDLRSPLTLMRGYATMMEMVGELNEQQSGYVQKIIQGVESMARLVNNLLDLGRIEAGVDLQLEFIDVKEIVDRCTSNAQPQATIKQIQLVSRIDEVGIPPVQADPALLTQSIQNLIENAIKYTDSGGKVLVQVKLNPETIAFEVSDTGIGIAPVDQPRLFEKFYRGAQRDARRRQGTGLGLAIVKSIAERHKGRVWVNSQLGKGSTFGFEIPIRQPQK